MQEMERVKEYTKKKKTALNQSRGLCFWVSHSSLSLEGVSCVQGQTHRPFKGSEQEQVYVHIKATF